MAETMTLSKILIIREKEKKEAQQAFSFSQVSFEKKASRLYTLLRRKEDAEDSYDRFIHSTVQLEQIKGQAIYIEQLNKQIIELQNEVQEARKEMNRRQSKLTNAHVEVKKFEKLIERRKTNQAEMMRKKENESMDEISMQQYSKPNNGWMQ